jgi:hypothetical protein
MPEYKPSFVVFPGAFHPASCLDSFIATLQAAGFPAEAHSLRSLGNPDAVVDDDEAYMRSVIDPHITAGKDVVVVVHSFAGFGGSSAISGIDKRGREARGEQGGVLGIIYLTAFVPLEGDSLYGLVQCRWPSWMQVNVRTMSRPLGIPQTTPLWILKCLTCIMLTGTRATYLYQRPDSNFL